MHRLFFKIFLWFWLAMTLIGAVGILLALTINPHKAEVARHEERLSRQSQELIGAYEAGGLEALREKTRELNERHQGRSFLFRGAEGPLAGGRVPPMARDLALQAAQSGDLLARPGRRGAWIAFPAGGGYILVAEVKPPTHLQRLFNPYSLAPRLLAAFLVTGLVAYLLARSLAAPIGKLRRATRQFAAGDLATRVSAQIRGRDEIAGLARDFDGMAERIENLVGAQQSLLRDISHELRSPLARLNVALELVRQKAGAEAAAPLDRIEREALRLNEMIGQLLSLNQLESGSEALPKTEVDLAALVGEVVADAGYEAQKQHRTVAMEQSEAVSIMGNAELLRRAIENVVRNAVHYTAAGTAVAVSLARGADGGAVIRVRDRGPGVPEEALEKIFQPFYRVGDARDRRSGGTGIGLAITERAVRLHGGRVRADNAPQGGLIIEIELRAGSLQ